MPRTYKIDGKTYTMTPAEEAARDLEEQTELAVRPMRDWKDSMVLSDTGVPRWAEDLYDALPLEVRNAVDPVTKNAIADKKAQRQLRPV
jgi:hypothetical protein